MLVPLEVLSSSNPHCSSTKDKSLLKANHLHYPTGKKASPRNSSFKHPHPLPARRKKKSLHYLIGWKERTILSNIMQLRIVKIKSLTICFTPNFPRNQTIPQVSNQTFLFVIPLFLLVFFREQVICSYRPHAKWS